MCAARPSFRESCPSPYWQGPETDNYDLVFHALAVRNTAKFSPAAGSPSRGSMPDWKIFRELRRHLERLQGHQPRGVIGRLRRAVSERMTPRRMLDLALRFGPHGAMKGGVPRPGGLTLARLERNKHGVDLGPLVPRLPGRLYTPDKKIRLAPDIL